MSMAMSMSFEQVQRLEICTENSIATSVFPLVEELLNEDSEYQKALEWVDTKDAMENFRSVVDFLFCKVAGQTWRNLCMQFYAGKGNQLRRLVSIQKITRWEEELILALYHARDLMDNGAPKPTWREIVALVAA